MTVFDSAARPETMDGMTSVAAAGHPAPWVQYAQRVPGDPTILLCFPHAGGAASSYRGWAGMLAGHGIEAWPLQLPGRESRFTEPLVTDLDGLTSTLVDLLHDTLAERPYALYGHSAGAFMAYAFAVRAAARGCAPYHLFVGACRPPNRPDPEFPLHKLPRDRFLARLMGYGRMPAEILDYPDLTEMMITATRADLQLVEEFPWRPDLLVDCPVTAFGGIGDATVPVDTLSDWRLVTGGPFQRIVLPGGHFPPPAAESLLLGGLRRGLR